MRPASPNAHARHAPARRARGALPRTCPWSAGAPRTAHVGLVCSTVANRAARKVLLSPLPERSPSTAAPAHLLRPVGDTTGRAPKTPPAPQAAACAIVASCTPAGAATAVHLWRVVRSHDLRLDLGYGAPPRSCTRARPPDHPRDEGSSGPLLSRRPCCRGRPRGPRRPPRAPPLHRPPPAAPPPLRGPTRAPLAAAWVSP